jgi:hypothetical protein
VLKFSLKLYRIAKTCKGIENAESKAFNRLRYMPYGLLAA